MVVANAPVPTKTPHKHAELIKAWADGAEIEFFSSNLNEWISNSTPSWYEDINYRIKPIIPENKHMDALIILSPHAGLFLYNAAPDEANCVLVFDGTTNELIDARAKGPKEAIKQPSEALYNHAQWLGSLNEFKRTGEL